jgi:hypothetical protein
MNIRVGTALALVVTGCLIVITIAVGHIAGWW